MMLCHINISEKIKAYRSVQKMSQRAFGELIGVSAQAVSKWEKDLCYPDITLLPSLAAIVGCTITDFFV